MCFSQMIAFYEESVNFHELVETFQEFVSILPNWLSTNKLVAHECTTKLIIFTSRIHPVRFNQNLFLAMICSVSFLGIKIIIIIMMFLIDI